MPRTSVEVDKSIWKELDTAYQRKCGRSSSQLVTQLNDSGKFERKEKKGELTDVISDRTINQFFKPDGKTKKLNGVYLNYLCEYLLEVESYPDAKEKFGVTDEAEVITVPVPVITKLDEQAYLPKYRAYVQRKCGFIRIPFTAMQQKQKLQNIYVNTRIREEVSSRKPKTLTQLQAELDGRVVSTASILDAPTLFSTYRRIMIWGATGSGKTTLLKDQILNCAASAGSIPVFISLIDYIKQHKAKGIGLEDAILQEFVLDTFEPTTVTYWSEEQLNAGNCFIALDGLDEVPVEVIPHIYDELEQFIDEFPNNAYALTCRFGGTEYPPQDFAEVEVAQWTSSQADEFIQKWFSGSAQSESVVEFLQALERNTSVSEFKKNPLLLTLLCQLHEEGYGIPQNQANILEDAVDFYMRKWDESRRIQREPILDKKLSRQRRRDLFAIIAASAMPKGKTFWESWELKAEIKDFIQKIPGVTASTIEVDAGQILTALEAQHGLLTKVAKDYYSFVHRSFQEYFVFQDIIMTIGQSVEKIEILIKERVLDPNYRNVFLLIAERQKDAEPLLREMAKYLTEIAKNDARIQQNFDWLEKITTQANVNTPAWRACVFSYDLETPAFLTANLPDVTRAEAQQVATNLRGFNVRFASTTAPTARINLVLRLAVIDKLVSDRAEGKQEDTFEVEKYDPAYKQYQENLKQEFCGLIHLLTDANVPGMEPSLQQLIDSFPASDASENVWQIWQTPFRAMTQQYLQLGHNHDVTAETIKTLNDYIYVAHLLSEILLQDIRCEQQTKQKLLNSLFLPYGAFS
ncbi:MAG: NACHT domain-containing protein [Spirulina sp. SIO3F2]|nr:NACHT domain-containing protein [Spirulina sp. SIO3F2]